MERNSEAHSRVDRRLCEANSQEVSDAASEPEWIGDAGGEHEWKGTAKRIPEWIGDAEGEPRKRTRPRRSER